MSESLFNKVAGLKPCNFILKRIQRRCFFMEFSKILRTSANNCSWVPQKISQLLVLGKLMLEGKIHNWVTYTFCWKYEAYEVSLCDIHVIPTSFCYFFQASKERKWCDNDFKIFWANYCSSTITDSAKQKRKEIFEARIFSHPLRFFHSYLIYF